MKKIILFVIAIFTFVGAYAVGPNLQDITLRNSRGETLDFYADRSNKVVYKAPGTNYSRGGTFYVGSTISSRDGWVEARFSVEIAMSYGLKKLSGTIYYRRSNGHVSYVTLDGSRFSSSSRSVAPRR